MGVGPRRAISEWRGRALIGGALLPACATFAFWDVLTWDPSQEIAGALRGVEAEFFSASGGSPLLVLLLTAWLVWRRRDALARAVAHRRSPAAAAVFLIPAAILYFWAHYTAAPELLVPVISLAIPGVGIVLVGTAALRVLWFPSLFSLLAFPVPVVPANLVLYPLQLATATATGWILDSIGVRNLVFADLIHARGNVFQVIETCAGLASVQTYIMGTAIYLELFPRGGSQAIFLLGLTPFLSFFFNALRVVTIVLNPYSEFAAVHTFQGMALLFVGMFAVAGFDWLHFRFGFRTDPTGADRNQAASDPPARSFPDPIRSAVVCTALALASPTTSLIPTWKQVLPDAIPVARLPVQLESWKASGLRLDRTFLGSARFSEWSHRRYTRGNEYVDLFLGADDHLDRFKSVISDKTAVLSSGWEILEREATQLGSSELEAQALVLTSQRATVLAYHWYLGVRSPIAETLWSTLLLDRSPWLSRDRALVVRLSTPVSRTRAGRDSARARLDAFYDLLRQTRLIREADRSAESSAP